MRKQIRIFVLVVLMAFSPFLEPTRAWAQAGQNEASTEEITGTRKQIATIIFAGLAGAVLGLSTLSFYGRPQDHLSNIAVGFAVGVIVGTVATTYQAIHAPYEQYQVFDKYNKQDQLLRTSFLSNDQFAQKNELSGIKPLSLSWNF